MNKPFIPLIGQEPPATIIANELLMLQIEQLQSRANVHIQSFNQFWANGPPPAEILAAMGDQACRWLAGARHSVAALYQLVSDFNEQLPPEKQISFDALLPVQFREPPLAFVEGDDGTATLEPDETKDAWGRPIPEPEPEPEEEEPEP